jgi:hypothetical protein
MNTLKGFARYSLNRDNQLHKCTCHGVHNAEVALSGVLREQSPVEDFLFEDNFDGSRTFVSDYSVLSGQAAIDQMNPTQLRRYLNGLRPSSSPYTHHYDDDFLLEYCKDRNIQSYTEMQAWLDHLISEGQSIESDVAAFQAAKLAQQQKSADLANDADAAQSSTE